VTAARPRALAALLACWFALAGLAALPGTALAQTVPTWDYRGLEMTRADLEGMLAQFETVIGSTAYSERLREEARASSAQIRERLDEGDFRVGDRIVLEIEGETQTNDTVMVEPGREIALTGMQRISLAGVLRSELQPHLEREIGKFIKNPTIRTASLIRLSIQGSVGRPGFYVVPATALLEDVIMMAGGPAATADLENIELGRSGEVLMDGEELRAALTDGRSVDQLNLRAGDQIVIPAKSTTNVWAAVGRYALFILTPLLLGIRLF
jgi:hypothetical protein